MKKSFAKSNSINMKGGVEASKIFDIQKSADILIHAEAFDLKSRFAVRQSFSTKLVDYFYQAKCIFAAGLKDIASIDYLIKNDAAVIPKFVKQLLNDEAPTINGDGKQSRDFTYIENVIEANLKGMLSGSETAGEAFNIAYGGQEYLIDIYKKMCELLEKNIEPVYGPDRAGDIKHSNADISKARKMLGYNPEYSFSDGIVLAIDWYKKNL